MLNLFWTPLYLKVVPRFLLTSKRKLSFHKQLLQSQSLLYFIGEEKAALDRALRDIDSLKVFNKNMRVCIVAHHSLKSHLDCKLFPELFFYAEKKETNYSQDKKILEHIKNLKPQVVIGRIGSLTVLMRLCILQAGSSLRILFGDGDFSPFATISCKDCSISLVQLFPGIAF